MRNPRVVDVLAVAVGVTALMGSIYTSFPWIIGQDRDAGGRSAAQYQAELSPGSGRTENEYDIDNIIAAHLFGDPSAETETADTASAPETRLQLKLLGMIASSDQRYARALIGVDSRNVSAYGVGDSINDTNAIVHAVDSGRVILKRGGAMESLNMDMPRIAVEIGKSAPNHQ